MLVPTGLARDGDEVVRRAISAWAAIEPLDQTNRPKSWLTFLGLVGGLGILLFANSLWVILPLGMVLLLYSIYFERRLLQNDNILPGVTRMYTTTFSFLIILVVLKSCFLGMVWFMGR